MIQSTDSSYDHFTGPDEAQRIVSLLATHTPTEWYDYLNLSSAFFVLGDTPRALLYARDALMLARTPATLLNMAVILESEGAFLAALPFSEEAHYKAPTDPAIACHYSDALLRMGRFQEAWPIYSWSHEDWSRLANRIPEWDGHASIRNRRVLVLACGGYGDQILHLRWVPRLFSLGATITFLCAEPMHSLLRDVPYIHFLAAEVDSSKYDFYIPVTGLARHFCPFPELIPTEPYLVTYHNEPNIPPRYGLCTRAGESHFPRRHRSLTPLQERRILDAGFRAGIEWRVLNFPQGTEWKHTATILNTLDRVVSVDTGVAHLAGAMGIPCDVILPAISAAYYALGDRNPFYPSQRLFRNEREGINDAVNALCASLEAEAA